MPGQITFQQKPRSLALPSSTKKHGARSEPTAIFANLDYKRRGETALPENFMKVVAYVEDNFVVPENFEVLATFGVHSGSCYERRLIAAYTWGQLRPKNGQTAGKMCVECGQMGHYRDDCAELLNS